MKSRISKCSKYTNVIMATNVILQAPILGCVSEIVCDEMLGTMYYSLGRPENESESCHVVLSFVLLVGKAKNERISCRESDVRGGKLSEAQDYIGNPVTWLVPNARFIFALSSSKYIGM